jgi:hypothetical protein
MSVAVSTAATTFCGAAVLLSFEKCELSHFRIVMRVGSPNRSSICRKAAKAQRSPTKLEQGEIMSLWLVLLIIIVGAALWFWRTRATPQLQGETGKNHGSNPYHCVSIHYRKDACATVIALDGKRFLSKEAPPLPLAGCDAAACRCKYVHHPDRREDERRTPQAVNRGLVSAAGYTERRAGGDRRRNPTPLQLKPQIGR